MQDSSLDPFDRKILDALQADGRLTNQQLADVVALSPSQCSRRRAALEARGFITGYHAQLDAALLGYTMLVFIQITLNTHSGDNAQRFRALIRDLPEVQECFALTGDADYLLKALLGGLPGLAALVNDILLPHDSVAHVRSSIVFETLKVSRLLPLARGA